MLATAEDLATLVADSGLSEERATLLLELATAEVQAAAGQRIVLVEDDEIEFFAQAGVWLELPERPVTAISSLTIDGGDELVAGDDYKRPAGSAKLWRRCGWTTCWTEPSIIAATYSHGYADDDQRIQFGRSSTLGVAKQAAGMVSGVESESIDDYRVQYAEAVTSVMAASPNLVKALRRYYGDRAGPARLS